MLDTFFCVGYFEIHFPHQSYVYMYSKFLSSQFIVFSMYLQMLRRRIVSNRYESYFLFIMYKVSDMWLLQQLHESFLFLFTQSYWNHSAYILACELKGRYVCLKFFIIFLWIFNSGYIGCSKQLVRSHCFIGNYKIFILLVYSYR
jgi:hypothetical protein